MLPAIGLVSSVEMIRDGGSLAAVFQGTDSCEYWVCLPIRLDKLASAGWERIGYENPVVVDRLAQRQIPITWQQAQIFLSQMRPLLCRERDLHWFEVMFEAVRLQGGLRSRDNPDFGRATTQQKDIHTF